ncbi:MFS transporter [Bacillus sp. AFS041924]|uniref:MFS transporter n=1 Tax=Bacillus sp. AFS041924 TaxID=2033503 RepID=UPI000BFE261B|nr:MFS transporter [Bacillus sp. AFS041924]PGS47946.1 MFS transporter [Bacillus sp. AFS041924]
MGEKVYFLYTKAFSDIGSMMELVVMNAVIYSMTKSTTWLAAILALRVCGGILTSLFSGVIADRYNRRKLMIFSDITRGISILVLCIFPSPTMFAIVAFMIGALGSFFSVSFSADLPQIFGEENILKINAFISRLAAISMVIGFLGSAFLSTVVDYRVIIGIDALSYFMSAFVLIFYKWENTVKNNENKNWRQLFDDLKEVKTYVLIKPLLLLVFMVFLFQTFSASSHNVGVPILAEKISSEHATFYQGLIWGTWGIGGIISTWLIPKVSWLKQHYLFMYYGASVLTSLGFILFLSNQLLWIVFLFAFFTGFFDNAAGTYFSTMIQKTENSIRGRIFGVANLLNRVGFTIGFVAASPLLSFITMPHLVWLFHGSLIILIICVTGYLLIKRKIDFNYDSIQKNENEIMVSK